MVEHRFSPLDRVFRALADPTRRRMLRRLSKGECTVSELAEPLEMSLAAASKHIKTLEDAGLMRRDRRGREHWCSLDARPLEDVQSWLKFYEAFWSGRLDALERELRREDEVEHTAQKRPVRPPRPPRPVR
ncbi:MAG TPA: metalloregulator ArsR/SmtB family transcription factor [Phycisphaerales bacterium]|nr:metalloregulator ArsR/SmtB family transcription factor [Phycisphaerales bacterium]